MTIKSIAVPEKGYEVNDEDDDEDDKKQHKRQMCNVQLKSAFPKSQ